MVLQGCQERCLAYDDLCVRAHGRAHTCAACSLHPGDEWFLPAGPHSDFLFFPFLHLLLPLYKFTPPQSFLLWRSVSSPPSAVFHPVFFSTLALCLSLFCNLAEVKTTFPFQFPLSQPFHFTFPHPALHSLPLSTSCQFESRLPFQSRAGPEIME